MSQNKERFRAKIAWWRGHYGPGRLTPREQRNQLEGVEGKPLVDMENFNTMRIALKMVQRFGSDAVKHWPPSEELIAELFEEEESS